MAQDLTDEERADMPSCNLSETIHNKWLQASGKKGTDIFEATLDDYVRAFMQVTSYYSFLKGERAGTGPRREELRLRSAQQTKDPLKIRSAMAKFPAAEEWCNRTPEFTGEEVFGSKKRGLNTPIGSEFDTHRPDKVSFSHPRVQTRSAKAQCTQEFVDLGQAQAERDDTVAVAEEVDAPAPCKAIFSNGIIHISIVQESDCDVKEWHIARVKKARSGAACWAMQAVSKNQCRAKIVRENKDTPAPTYSGKYKNYHTNAVLRQDFHFCPDDIERCVKGTFRKWVLTRPDSIPDVWPVKRGTNLKKNEILTLERGGFQLPQRLDISPRRLFHDTLDSTIDLSMYPLPPNPDYYPTSRFEKKIKRRKSGPLTDQLLRWGSALTVKAKFRKRTMVPMPGLGCIIHLVVEKSNLVEEYILTLGTFPECTCLDFVDMKSKSFRMKKAWVNCKHIYYIYRVVCKLNAEEDLFIHAPTLSFNEVKEILQRGVLSRPLE